SKGHAVRGTESASRHTEPRSSRDIHQVLTKRHFVNRFAAPDDVNEGAPPAYTPRFRPSRKKQEADLLQGVDVAVSSKSGKTRLIADPSDFPDIVLNGVESSQTVSRKRSQKSGHSHNS